METPFQKYLVLSFGYKDLVGIIGFSGIERIEKQIKEYNLYAVLETCAKISNTLLHRGTANPLGQAELLSGIFTDKNQRIQYYEKARAKAAGSAWAIFNQQSVLTLVKMAFLHCSIESGKAVTPKDIEQIGYWLLLINDDCFSEESGEKIALPNESHERERLKKALARYQFFHASERLGYKIARYRWIISYLKTNKPHGIDIEQLFKESTNGATLDDYLTVCLSLLVKWVNLSTSKPDLTESWVTCTDVYFKTTKLPKEIINSVLEMIAMMPQEFDPLYQESIQTVLGGHEYFHYNFMPFAWKPLIWFQDKKCFVCPSAEYLFDKATEGVYRTIETHLRHNNRLKERDTHSIAWGDAFEQYINSVLKESFGDNCHINPTDKKTSDQMVDALVSSSSFIFLFETKNMHWPYKTIVSGDLDSSNTAIKQLFAEKGLAQIANCIRKYKSGEWDLPVDAKDKSFIPVLVTSESMPQDTYNRRFYDSVSSQAGSIVEDSDVLPFIILTAEELEILEAIASEKGANEALQILAEYSHMYLRKNELYFTPEALGFKNYLFFKGYENPAKSSTNKRLLKFFDDAMNDVSLKTFGVKISHKKKKGSKK